MPRGRSASRARSASIEALPNERSHRAKSWDRSACGDALEPYAEVFDPKAPGARFGESGGRAVHLGQLFAHAARDAGVTRAWHRISPGFHGNTATARLPRPLTELEQRGESLAVGARNGARCKNPVAGEVVEEPRLPLRPRSRSCSS